jgi:polyketide synthase PksL
MQDVKDIKAVSEYFLELLCEVTGLDKSSVNAGTTFESIHLESLAITAFTARIAPFFSGLSKTFLFDCRTINEVCSYLLSKHDEEFNKLSESLLSKNTEQPESNDSSEDNDWPVVELLSQYHDDNNTSDIANSIAVIGMDGIFPGAESLTDFWQLLKNGTDMVGDIPFDRWSMEGFFEDGTESRKTRKSYSKWGAFIKDVDKFDAQFFGVSARDAALMDPQERLFLQCAWHAMENAALFGDRAESLREGRSYNIGVFAGVTTNTYQLLGPEHWQTGGVDIPGAFPWSIANRVSFALNLSGPSVAIDTACSSSLVALNLACESILKQQCKAAIVGGVNLYLHPSKYIQLCQHQMLSPTGRCHTFGKEADGFVPGEGVGVIILKPLTEAKKNKDRVLGVIKGSAANHSGRTNGYTVPNAQTQSQLVLNALGQNNIEPSSISYIEAHGTGTKLGDPIEFAGLVESLDAGNTQSPCGIGSVKSNIGHLESAAGIAGIIKILLQFR